MKCLKSALVESKTRVKAGPDSGAGTKFGFRKVIKSGVAKFLLKIYLVEPVAEPQETI